ncbi:DUF2017 family protein [Citricoccus nitrophenolicus]|uniref:DUF2017 family protein n=1 Tax=Citricoccus nitrophenolicus TaxID=863575 RepID=UPI0039B58758
MARAFKSTPKGFTADLEKAERRLLRTLFADVIQLLDAEEQPRPVVDPTGASEDPFWDIVAGLGPFGATFVATEGEAGSGGADDGPVPSEAAATPHRQAPPDEALARLLPPGVHGDTPAEQAAAGEFRALTEDSVRRSKTADLQRAVAALQVNPLVLEEAEAVSFSRALNDVRLVLSARLGIDSEEDAERVHTVDDWSAATDVESYMALLYNFTTWLLETLMLALTTQLPEAP